MTDHEFEQMKQRRIRRQKRDLEAEEFEALASEDLEASS